MRGLITVSAESRDSRIVNADGVVIIARGATWRASGSMAFVRDAKVRFFFLSFRSVFLYGLASFFLSLFLSLSFFPEPQSISNLTKNKTQKNSWARPLPCAPRRRKTKPRLLAFSTLAVAAALLLLLEEEEEEEMEEKKATSSPQRTCLSARPTPGRRSSTFTVRLPLIFFDENDTHFFLLFLPRLTRPKQIETHTKNRLRHAPAPAKYAPGLRADGHLLGRDPRKLREWCFVF